MNSRKRLENRLVNAIFEINDKKSTMGLLDREGQEDMSLDIADAFVDWKNIIIEAGVGIGKSFGYLIPGLVIYELTKAPIILATSSIQLSEQLMRDVDVIGHKLGIRVSPVVGKGMTHYTCKHRASEIQNSSGFKKRSDSVSHLVEQILDGSIHERSHIKNGVKENDWNQVNVNRCLFERCSYKSDCAFFDMRNKIAGYSSNGEDINVVIVNQDLLISDLKKKNETGKGLLVRNPSLIIIDEAHNFEDKVRGALTENFTEEKSGRLYQRAFSFVTQQTYDKEIEKNYNLLQESTKMVFDIIADQIRKISEYETERYSFEPPDVDYTSCVSILQDFINILSLFNEGKKEREIDEITMELYSLKKLMEILSGLEEDYLIWATKFLKKGKVEAEISTCPKHIQNLLRESLFRNENVVLTSATLCQSGNTIEEQYQYTIDSLGFYGRVAEPKQSPFNYNENALMYISEDMPHFSNENKIDYLSKSVNKIIELCNITDGRTLVLMTAKEDMNFIKERILEIPTNWEKIFQMDGSNQEAAIQKFRETKGVLFGTGVFWEGINIPGSDLSQVIILRLPFPVPTDPIIEYKTSISKDSFNEIMIPNMLIRLRQGVGRLIRSENDKGIISILDSRISQKYNKFYRQITLDSLPFKTYTEKIDDVREFAKSKMFIPQ